MNRPHLLITIGTDFHRFDRIIDWVDTWLAGHPALAEMTLVQHGASRPSRVAKNVGFLDYDTLIRSMRDAEIIVVHGGPATIFEARGVGRVPICVPRDPALAEIVDSHQQRFTRHLAALAMVHLCEDESAFTAAMETAVADPDRFRVEIDETRFAPAIEQLSMLVHELTAGRVRHARRGR